MTAVLEYLVLQTENQYEKHGSTSAINLVTTGITDDSCNSPAPKPNICSLFDKSTNFFTEYMERALSVLRRGGM